MDLESVFVGAKTFNGGARLRVKVTAPLVPAPASRFAKGWKGQAPPRRAGLLRVTCSGSGADHWDVSYQVGVITVDGKPKLLLERGEGLIGVDTDLEVRWSLVEGGWIPLRSPPSQTWNDRRDAALRLLGKWGFGVTTRGKGAWGIRWCRPELPGNPTVDPLVVLGAVALAKGITKRMTGTIPPEADILPRDPKVEEFNEGFARYYTTKSAERDSRLVRLARERSGGKCSVCGFDFGKAYGLHGQGFCEVHHLHPIAKGERVNEIKDVRAVCANCHRMLHKGTKVLTISELQAKLKKSGWAIHLRAFNAPKAKDGRSLTAVKR